MQLEPAFASGLSSGAAAVTAGGSFSCALRSGGGLACWGASGFGLFGEDGMDRPLPVHVSCL